MDLKQDSHEAETVNIGDALLAARKSKNLSPQDIASQLNLKPSFIEKLESNQFDLDVPNIFVRGYIASYAKKVGLDGEALCQSFDQQVDNSVEPLKKLKSVADFQPSSQEVRISSPIFKLVTYVIVLGLFACALWAAWQWFESRDVEISSTALGQNQIALNSDAFNQWDKSNSTEKPVKGELTSEQDKQESYQEQLSQKENEQQELIQQEHSQEVTLESESLANINHDKKVSTISTETTKALGSSSEDNSEIESQQLVNEIELEFEFIADCWVKVTDADDKVLAIGVKKDGKQMLVSGVAPLSVVLGEPSAVELLKVNGENFDLSSYPAGRSARLKFD